MNVEPANEHRWLEQMVGEWTFETSCSMGPDQPEMNAAGSETVRSFGGLWILADGDGGDWKSRMTMGYDTALQCFVGSFIATMMTNLWVYRGQLDAARRVLTLDTEGPNMTDGSICRYQDIHEIIGPDERTLSSRYQDASGQWQPFMVARYHRKK